MKFAKEPQNVILLLIMLIFSQSCFSMAESMSYSELLRGAVHGAGKYRGGYYLFSSLDNGDYDGDDLRWRPFHCNERLVEKEAVPFLVEVITNGPDWPSEEFKGYNRIAPHIGRCYAVLSLASTKDRRAYPVLTDLLQNGAYLGELKIPEKEKAAEIGFMGGRREERAINKGDLEGFDIRAYAAMGLGILGDPNAVGLLVDAFNSDSPQVRRESFVALARIGDMRATKAMIEHTGSDKAINDMVIRHSMIRFTRIVFPSKWDLKEGTWSSTDFPELGNIPLSQNPEKKVWQHWFKVGRKWTRQQCESKHSNWKEAKKKHPQRLYTIKKNARELTKPGIAALPYLIDKIAAGETELIEQVSHLTRGKIKKDAGRENVLQWWNKNKAKWIIPFED